MLKQKKKQHWGWRNGEKNHREFGGPARNTMFSPSLQCVDNRQGTCGDGSCPCVLLYTKPDLILFPGLSVSPTETASPPGRCPCPCGVWVHPPLTVRVLVELLAGAPASLATTLRKYWGILSLSSTAVEVTSPLELLMRKSMRGIPTCMRYDTCPLGPSSRSMATTWWGERPDHLLAMEVMVSEIPSAPGMQG